MQITKTNGVYPKSVAISAGGWQCGVVWAEITPGLSCFHTSLNGITLFSDGLQQKELRFADDEIIEVDFYTGFAECASEQANIARG